MLRLVYPFNKICNFFALFLINVECMLIQRLDVELMLVQC